MTREEKRLLLKDLCARLPYGVIVKDRNATHELSIGNTEFVDLFNGKCHIKPYLRPMSSMTEEEREKWASIINYTLNKEKGEMSVSVLVDDVSEYNDWLDKNMFDYRGLIPMGLALEAPKDMYKIR
jgi:hypothetical protein